MRLLVTGATGFVGARVLALAGRAFPGEVVGLARGRRGSGPDPAQVCADLLDPDQTRAALDQVRPTHLLHLAWDVTPGRYWQSVSNLVWLESSLRLFRLFSDYGGERIVSIGSCAEYDWDGRPSDEGTTELRPGTFYGQMKNTLRAALEASSGPLNVSWAWARLFWMYGPGETEGRLLPDIARAVLAGEEVATSSGLQRRDYMHVDDVARALLHVVAGTSSGPMNIGSGEAVAVRDIAFSFAEKMGRPDLLRIGAKPDNPGEATLVVADVRRLASTGFQPSFDLQSGLADTARWWTTSAARSTS
jgi:nucleoside-diphosphate-sugar epimerase